MPRGAKTQIFMPLNCISRYDGVSNYLHTVARNEGGRNRLQDDSDKENRSWKQAKKGDRENGRVINCIHVPAKSNGKKSRDQLIPDCVGFITDSAQVLRACPQLLTLVQRVCKLV